MVTILTPAEAKPRLGEFDVILDVRSQKEWDAGHLDLPSVRFVERLHLHPEKVAELAEIASKKVLVYCAVGGRATTVGKMLEESFTNLYIVTGGGYDHLI